MATKKIKRFQEGGMSDKDRGLEASKDEKVGFFERLRMGNIDDPSSEAYRRFGAGRGKAENTPVEDRIATPVTRPTPAAQATSAVTAMDEMEAANAQEPIPVPAGPRAEKSRVNTQTAKPSAPAKSTPAKSASTKTSAYPMTGAQPTTKTYDRSGGPTAEELANHKPPSKLTKKQQIEQEIDSIKPTAEQTQKGLEAASVMAGGVGLKGLQALAKKLATPKMAKYTQEALPAPTKRLTYDKAGTVARKRAERAEARKSEMLKENAKRYGLDESSPGYEAAAGAVRKELGGKDFALKKGGSVKKAMPVKKMASGGSVSNPSKRADGIAIKGKTRCKMR
jgi:hypothetical protein